MKSFMESKFPGWKFPGLDLLPTEIKEISLKMIEHCKTVKKKCLTP